MEGDVYEGNVALHQTGSDETVNNVVSTIGDETGSVADSPGDEIVMSSECQEIDRGTPGRIRRCVSNHPTVLYLTRGCLPLICALWGGCVSWTVRG